MTTMERTGAVIGGGKRALRGQRARHRAGGLWYAGALGAACAASGWKGRPEGACGMPAMTWVSLLGGLLVIGSAVMVVILGAKKGKPGGEE